MQPSYYKECYAAVDNKACHGGGARWLFGEYLNQGVEVTPDERAFGHFYRSTYADLMKNGNSNVLVEFNEFTYANPNNEWSRLSVEHTNQATSRPMGTLCTNWALGLELGVSVGETFYEKF